jgi:hypothetical protein
MAAFWYQKQCFGLFRQSIHGCIVFLVVESVVPMFKVSEKNSCVSVFGPFLVPKAVHFSFSQPVLGWYQKQRFGLFGKL